MIALTSIGIKCDPWYFKESSSLLLITTGSEPSKARISCAKNPYFLSPAFSSESRSFLNQNDLGFSWLTKFNPVVISCISVLSLWSDDTVQ